MWIKQIHIDGYGIFAKFSLTDLSPGLNIVCGPNEAGKTTLRDFLTCILFGFDSRTAARDFHSPLSGGEHGGRLLISTDSGREYLIGRHTTKKNSAPAVVLDAHGEPVEERVLTSLVRQLSKESFINYFSVGLDELQAFQSLKGTELEAWLYKAGFSGRGRSVVQVLRESESARTELYKGRGKSRIAGLAAELDTLNQGIGRLEERPRIYQDLLARKDAIDTEITQKEELLQGYLRELGYQTKILELWSVWERLQQIEAELETRRAVYQDSARFVKFADEIIGLERGLTLYMQTTESVDQFQLQLTSINERVKTAVADLDHNRPLESFLSVPTGRVVELQAITLARKGQESAALIVTRENTVAQTSQVVQERQTQVDRLSKNLQELSEGCDLGHDLEAKEKAVWEISRMQNTLGTIESRLEAAQNEQRLLERLQGSILPWVLTLLVGAGLTGFGYSIGIAATIIAMAGLIHVAYKRRRSRAELRESRDKIQELELAQGEISARLAEQCRFVAGAESLTEQELEECKLKLSRGAEAKKVQQDLAQASERLSQGMQQLSEAKKLARDAQSEMLAVEERWNAFLDQNGFPQGLSQDAFSSYLAALRHLQELVRQREETRTLLAQAKHRMAEYTATVNLLHAELGLPLLTEDSLVSAAVVALVRRLSEARQDLAKNEDRVSLIERIRIGVGVAADRTPELLAELAKFRQPLLQMEIDRLTQEVAEVRMNLDQLKAERGSVGLEIQQLENERDLAGLRLGRAIKLEQLERAAQDWLKWTILNYSLGKAKQRYEEEKQPEVLKSATKHFSAVTEGRYIKVFSPVDSEGIYVQTADLHKLDATSTLSQGTTEQLYLCLRLALAEKVVQDGESLPLLLDDVLVNMDPARFRQLCTLIGSAARNHQLFFFTCHPQVASLLAAQSMEYRLWWLSDGELVDGWETGFEGTAASGFTG